MRRTLFIAIATFAIITLGHAAAHAQASEVSELWREWAVLERQQRVEAAELQVDRQRHRARREARLEPKRPAKKRRRR